MRYSDSALSASSCHLNQLPRRMWPSGSWGSSASPRSISAPAPRMSHASRSGPSRARNTHATVLSSASAFSAAPSAFGYPSDDGSHPQSFRGDRRAQDQHSLRVQRIPRNQREQCIARSSFFPGSAAPRFVNTRRTMRCPATSARAAARLRARLARPDSPDASPSHNQKQKPTPHKHTHPPPSPLDSPSRCTRSSRSGCSRTAT